jgi:hypothetical protein
MVGKHEQGGNAFELGQVTGAEGGLQGVIQGLDSLATKGYGQVHGMPRFQWKLVASLVRIPHPVPHHVGKSRSFSDGL